jgi:integrase
MIELAIETGMRRSELISLEWKNIYLESNKLVLNTSKNGKARIVPLTAKAKAVLEQINQVNDRVFSLTDVAVRQAWERLRTSCEITDLTFHDLRHEAISRLFEKGLNVPEVASISGHKTVSQLFRYVQVAIPDSKRLNSQDL